MLAEPRNKQKWAADPRNTHWSEDKNKFGYQLMSKMGWSEGKGLGANESGQVEHVKVKKRRENLGLGSTTNHSENWLAHQDDFNALLSNLNQKTSKPTDGEEKVEENERSSLKHSVKQSRKKIFYSKFIHSKDLSLKSKNDLACVMGQRSKSTPATPQELSEDEGAKSDTSTASCPVGDADSSHGIVTRNSEMNLQDYFAQKMAALKKRKENKDAKDNGDDSNECDSGSKRRDGNECHSESNRVGGNERDSESTKGVSDECKSEPNKDHDVCKDVRKSKKKKRKDKENETKESEDGVKFFVGAEDIEEEIGLKKKKKKSKKSKKNGEEINENCVNGDSSEIKRTGDECKGKKSEVQESVECVKSIVEEDDTEEEVGLQKKKSKKSKKSSDEMNVNVVDDLDQVVKTGDEDDGVKKKKKSSKQRNIEKIGENGEEKLEKSKKSKSSDETSFNGSSKDLNEIEMAEIENKEGKIKKKKSSKNKTEKETVDDEEEIAKNKKKKKRKYDKNDEANDLECNDVKKIKKSKSSKD